MRLLGVVAAMLIVTAQSGRLDRARAQSTDYQPLPAGKPETAPTAAAPGAADPRWMPPGQAAPPASSATEGTNARVPPPPPPAPSRVPFKVQPEVPIPDDGLTPQPSKPRIPPLPEGQAAPTWGPPGGANRGPAMPTAPVPASDAAVPGNTPAPMPGGSPPAPEYQVPPNNPAATAAPPPATPVAEPARPMPSPSERSAPSPSISDYTPQPAPAASAVAPLPSAPLAEPARPVPPPRDPRPAPTSSEPIPSRSAPPPRAMPPAEPPSNSWQANSPVQPERAPEAERPPPTPVREPSPATQAPAVFLEKIGPATLNVGMPLTYEIIVRNTGNAPVFNVRLDDDLPARSRLLRAEPTPEVRGERLVWSLGTLEPSTERRFKVEVQPSGEGELQSCATVSYAASTCLRTLITQPRLELSKTGPESAQVGDVVPFQLQVTNTGTGPATGVVLHDRLPPGLQHERGSNIDADIGTIGPGETKLITLQTTAVKSGQHRNEAHVTAENAAPATAQAIVVVTEPALFLRKTGPSARFLHREAEFDLEVSNPGTAPATNVRVTDILPPGLEYLDSSDGGVYEPNARTVTWNLGTLAPGHRHGLILKLQGGTAGDYLNHAVAQADRGLEAKSEAPLRIEGVPALMLEVVDLDDPVEIGAETTYEIRVLNQGSCASMGLQIIATVPNGMVPRDAAGPAPYRIQGQQVVFAPIERLAPHADALYRVRVFCREPGDWRFKVQMGCDQLHMPVNEEESTRIYQD